MGHFLHCRRGLAAAVVLVSSLTFVSTGQPTVANGTEAASTVHSVPRVIDVGRNATCAVESAGTVACWGDPDMLGAFQFIGDGKFARVDNVDEATSIAMGHDHACVVTGNAALKCWGENGNGQLGIGNFDDQATPVSVVGLVAAPVAVDVGSNHTCAVLSTGEVSCWGSNFYGQVGVAKSGDENSPLLVNGIDGAESVAVGQQHTCAVVNAGSVACWGRGTEGQLGDGLLTDSDTPVAVSGLNDVVGVTVGERFSCALHGDGSLSCWGSNSEAQFGTPTPASSSAPIDTQLGPFSAVDAGSAHMCALDMFGERSCWGSNEDGESGTGGFTATAPPTSLPGGPSVAIAAGSRHSCSLSRHGEVECWGSNDEGQLGAGLVDEPNSMLHTVELDAAEHVSVGSVAACALSGDGTARCWGSAAQGTLGHSSVDDISGPVEVDLAPIAQISSGGGHACAINDSDVWCWGRNVHGQVGQPSGNLPAPATPTELNSSLTFLEVAAGQSHTCARYVGFLKNVLFWGNNLSGQLGNGSTSSTHVPNAPSGNFLAVDMAVGYLHTCIADTTGGVRCWGANGNGQLGNGTTTSSLVPVSVPISDVKEVVAGSSHTCALKNDGSVWCWGFANLLGSGPLPTNNFEFPLKIQGLSDVVQIAASSGHTCALLADTSVTCWGQGGQGQLGVDPVTFQRDPVAMPGSLGTTALDVGDRVTCLVVAGPVRCVGANYDGRLGQASKYALPQKVGVDISPALPPSITPVVPARLLDTRTAASATTVDGQDQGIGRRSADTSTAVLVAGRGGIPADASAVVVNVAAVNPQSTGFLTFSSCGQPRPVASNLNYRAGVTIANSATVGLDADGRTCIYTSHEVDLALDVLAYVPATSLIDTPAPARLLDSRALGATVDGTAQALGVRPAGSTTPLALAGRGGVGATAELVTVNVAAVQPETDGFVTIHRCDEARPLAANLNFASGVNIANGATVEIDPAGSVCLYVSAATHLVVDLVAVSPVLELQFATTPSRLMDTRTATGVATIDGQELGMGPIAAGETYEMTLVGRAGVARLEAATLNLAVVRPEAKGYLTVFPCREPQPVAANINFDAGTTISNTLTIAPGPSGDVCIFASASTHVVVDLNAHTI